MKMDKKMVLSYLILLLLFPLMAKMLTGIFAHEIMGAGFVLLTAIHFFNNKGWTKNIFKSILQKDGAPKKISLLVLNSLLLVAVVIVAASGIMISIVIFGFLNIPYYEVFYRIHTISAQFVLLFSLVHLCLHMKTITAFFARESKRGARKQYE